MQGYDSVAIKADIEIGGSDQLFNVLAGRTLQKAYGMEPQNIITFELLEGTDGRKMSTSWGNVILIEDSPDQIYGKIMSMRDELIIKYFLLATDVAMEEIQKMKRDLQDDKVNPRDLKMKLAREIITMYYGKKDALSAEENFQKVFQDKGIPKNIKEIKIGKESMNIIDLLVETKLCVSKSEARRVIEQGGVKINGEKIKEIDFEVELSAKGKILQKGKRHFVQIIS